MGACDDLVMFVFGEQVEQFLLVFTEFQVFICYWQGQNFGFMFDGGDIEKIWWRGLILSIRKGFVNITEPVVTQAKPHVEDAPGGRMRLRRGLQKRIQINMTAFGQGPRTRMIDFIDVSAVQGITPIIGFEPTEILCHLLFLKNRPPPKLYTFPPRCALRI